MIPKRFAPLLIALFLSGVMSFVVSGVVAIKTLGIGSGFFMAWVQAWLFAWLVACPTVFVVRPVVFRAVEKLTTSR